MVLGKRTSFALGSGVVRYSRSMSGKRVAISSNMEFDVPAITQKHEFEELDTCSPKFGLEALPQDVLVKILCDVDHDDLKQLFHVSKIIREATKSAKKLHFEVTTPTKKTFALRNFFNFAPSDDAEEIEAPGAPKQLRIRRLSEKKLATISVALFAYEDDESWPRRKMEAGE